MLIFLMHIIHAEKVKLKLFDDNIFTNNKNRPTVCMTAMRYICPKDGRRDELPNS